MSLLLLFSGGGPTPADAEAETADKADLHERMLERIRVLERALADLSQPGIGHNQPPAPLDDEPLTEIDRQAITAAISVISVQPKEPEGPATGALEAANVFKRCSASVTAYLLVKGDLFVTEAVKAAGSETGKWTTRIALWLALAAALERAYDAVLTWLGSLPWPLP